MKRRAQSLVAVALAAAMSLGVGGSLVSTASADDGNLGKLSTTSYKEADYISNASLEALRDSMGIDVSQLSADQFKSIVDRAVKVEALTDEDNNYQQKWRITWNLSEAQQPQQWPGDGAVPYNSSGFDDMSNPDYSLMVSQDLTILTDSAHTPHWTVYNRKEPQKAFASFDLPLWKTQNGDVKKVTNQYNYSNTLKNMYYFGQYKDADGNSASDNWQDLAKACLAGNDTAKNVSSQSTSPCGDYIEWLNGSGKSLAAGQSDLSDDSTRYVDGKSYDRSLEQFNKFAQQIGGLQAFEWNTGSFYKNTENLGQIVSVEFTTQRTPWAGNGNEKVHRTFVAGHYKGNYMAYLYEGTQFKYVETPEKDSDGDGLTDRFEMGIGSCAFPKGSAEYNASEACEGVADPTDTDGDGVPDGKEVKSQTPKLYDTGFKIQGTDPTVAPQKPSQPSEPTGHKGEKVTGKTRPYETVELYDLTTGAVIASTIADAEGNYTLDPGQILARTDGSDGNPKSYNKYGNNIKFASSEDEEARKPVMMDGGTPVPDDVNHLVAVRVWSDGMDTLPGSDVTRPQFDTPTGVLPNLKVDDKTPVKDPSHLTDDEKQQVKDNITKSIPEASDVVVNDDGSATVTIGGNEYTIPSQDLITERPTVDAGKSSVGDPSKTTVPVSDGSSSDGKTSFTVTLNDQDGKPVTDVDNLTVTREDGKKVKPEIVNNGDGTYTVTVSSEQAGTSPLKVSVGDTEIGTTKPVTFEPETVDYSKSSAKVTRNRAAKLQPGREESNTIELHFADKFGNPTNKGVDPENNPLLIMGGDGDWNITTTPRKGSTGVYDMNITSEEAGTWENLTLRVGSVQGDVVGDTDTNPLSLEFVEPPADPAKSTITVDAENCKAVVADGEASCPVTITLKDENGNIITDDRTDSIQLSSAGPDGAKATFSDLKRNPDGTYTANMTSTKAGDFTVTATTGGQPVATSDTTTVTFVPGPLAKVSDWTGLSTKDDPWVAGEPVKDVTVKVFDKNGNPLLPGTEVYVTVPGVDGPVRGVVDENGVAHLDPFTPTKVGDNGTISVYPSQDDAEKGNNGVSTKETPVTTAGAFDPATSEVSVSTGDKKVGESHTVTISLKDKYGNPITDPQAQQDALGKLKVNASNGDTNATVGDFTPVEGKPGEFNAPVTATQPGEYTVDVSAPNASGEATELKNSPAKVNFVEPQPSAENTTFSVEPSPATKGYPVAVNGQVNDENGKPIAGRDVTVVLPDGTAVPAKTDENGYVVDKDGKPITFTADQGGEVKLYDGTSTDGEPLASTKLTVNDPVIGSGSSATVEPSDSQDSELNPGEKATVDGTIVDENGKPIAGRELTVVLPDGTEVPAVTDKDGKIVGKDGQPIEFTVGDKDGEVKIFDGNDTSDTAKPVVTVPVNPVPVPSSENSSVSVSPQNPTKGDTVTVSGEVKDKNGNPIAGRELTVVLPDGTEVPAVTDKDGKIVGKDGKPITFVAQDNGDVKVFDGSSTDGDPLASVPVTVSEPEPKPATIGDGSSATVKPDDSQDSELNPGDPAVVDGTIVDENGNPIAGLDITIVLPDGTEVPGTTDKDGKIVGKDGQPITFTVGDKDGEVKIFDGGDTTEPAKPVLTAPVHVVAPAEPVKKADPDHSSVTVSPADPNKGDTVVVSGEVKDSDGNPIAGQEVTIVLPDGTEVPGTTDKNGKIVGKDGQPITFVAEDSGDVKVLVDGDPLASATVTVKDGSADNNSGNNGGNSDNGSNNGGKDNSGKNNGTSDNAGKNNSKNNGNKGGAAAQNAQKSAQVLASTGAAVTAIVSVALAFVSFGMLALAARRRKDEE